MKHKIEITQETRVSIVVELEADSVDQAKEIAEERYIDGQYDRLFVEREAKNLVDFEYFIETF